LSFIFILLENLETNCVLCVMVERFVSQESDFDF